MKYISANQVVKENYDDYLKFMSTPKSVKGPIRIDRQKENHHGSYLFKGELNFDSTFINNAILNIEVNFTSNVGFSASIMSDDIREKQLFRMDTKGGVHYNDVYEPHWAFRRIGQSMEIRTPLITIGNLFVTVFVTKRKNHYIVTDGGWFDNGTYDEGLPVGETTNIKLAKQIASNHGFKTTMGNGGYTYFYTVLSDKSDLPVHVLNMASFVCEAVDASVLKKKGILV